MTARQRRFVDEYLVDLNATKAAERAGYSVKTAYSMGQRLLKVVEVATAIESAKSERAERTKVTADYVVGNLTEIVERCMQRAPVMVRRGKEVVQMTDEDDNHVWQFNAKDANGALNLLGKHLGMYIERREISVPAGTGVLAVPIPVTEEQWSAAASKQQADLVARPARAKGDDA